MLAPVSIVSQKIINFTFDGAQGERARLLATIKPIQRELLRRENFRESETVRLGKSLRKL